MFLIKKLIAHFVMPVPLAVLLVMLGGLLLLRKRQIGRWFVGAGVMVVFLSSWGPVGNALIAPLERHHAPVMDARDYSGVTAVVVLGTGYRSRAELPVTSQLNDTAVVRLMEGVRLYRQLPDARLVLTGGSSSDDSEGAAHGYAKAARALGVPEEDIIILDNPWDTGQEALAVRQNLGEQQVILVTSASHMPRAVRLFQTAGLTPIAAPTRHRSLETEQGLTYWVPSAEHLRKTERALYEYMGMVSVWLLNEAEVGE